MQFDTFKKAGKPTNLHWSDETLSNMPCGTFRASSEDVIKHTPALVGLLHSFQSILPDLSVSILDYEFDIKIHMLMPNQYPCIPNWHCDNVPRDENGLTDYNVATNDYKMFLWLSNGPCTQFLSRNIQSLLKPRNHGDVSRLIKNMVALQGEPTNNSLLTTIPPQQWVSISQLTPHRGMISQINQWRVFVRATHKSIVSERPVISTLRRHCKVYLDASNFTW